MVNNTLADPSSMRAPKFSLRCTYDSARCNKVPDIVRRSTGVAITNEH